MSLYKVSLEEINLVFGKDIQYALSTIDSNQPYVRIIDGFFKDGFIYITSYALARKVNHIHKNPNVSLCYKLNTFYGVCKNIGHPLDAKNKDIRNILKEVFHLFYNQHVDENDPNTCILKVELNSATMFAHDKKYVFNFNELKVDVSSHIDDMIYLP